ncbi:unnamed protein product [Cuscuta epithymum]|uniref:Uncharacterized protein n=1 Tax=Cuscuta epithymum TaxID=186058 RepID=A0AAV0EUS5_9ASTE|nr:unnamed protein product [Cuscuta epithymum]
MLKNTHAHLANTSNESPVVDLDLCDPTLYNKFLEFMKTQSANPASAHVAMAVLQHDHSSNDSPVLDYYYCSRRTITKKIHKSKIITYSSPRLLQVFLLPPPACSFGVKMNMMDIHAPLEVAYQE